MSRRLGAIFVIAIILGLAFLLLWRVYVHRHSPLHGEVAMSSVRHERPGRDQSDPTAIDARASLTSRRAGIDAASLR